MASCGPPHPRVLKDSGSLRARAACHGSRSRWAGKWVWNGRMKVREGKKGSSWSCQCGPSPQGSHPSSRAQAWSDPRAAGWGVGSSGALATDQLLCAPAPGGAPAPGSTQPIRIEPSSSHVAEGQTLDLNCVVPGQAHAQVTWYKRGGSLPTRHQVKQPTAPLPRPRASLQEGLDGAAPAPS